MHYLLARNKRTHTTFRRQEKIKLIKYKSCIQISQMCLGVPARHVLRLLSHQIRRCSLSVAWSLCSIRGESIRLLRAKHLSFWLNLLSMLVRLFHCKKKRHTFGVWLRSCKKTRYAVSTSQACIHFIMYVTCATIPIALFAYSVKSKRERSEWGTAKSRTTCTMYYMTCVFVFRRPSKPRTPTNSIASTSKFDIIDE